MRFKTPSNNDALVPASQGISFYYVAIFIVAPCFPGSARDPPAMSRIGCSTVCVKKDLKTNLARGNISLCWFPLAAKFIYPNIPSTCRPRQLRFTNIFFIPLLSYLPAAPSCIATAHSCLYDSCRCCCCPPPSSPPHSRVRTPILTLPATAQAPKTTLLASMEKLMTTVPLCQETGMKLISTSKH